MIENNIKRVNKRLAFFPGSFKPPHKGHWEMITANIDRMDEIHVFISNISERYISNKRLSKTHLLGLNKLNKIAKNNNIIDFATLYQYITNPENEISFNVLKEQLKKIYGLNKILDENIDIFLNKLSNTIFKSLRRTSTGKCIEPEISAEIFNLYINDYNLPSDKIFIHICENGSPIPAAIKFGNENCENCEIYIGSTTADEAQARKKSWEQTLISLHANETNTIQLLPIATKIQAARDIRANINNLTRDMFPNKISKNTFNKIKKLLQDIQ